MNDEEGTTDFRAGTRGPIGATGAPSMEDDVPSAGQQLVAGVGGSSATAAGADAAAGGRGPGEAAGGTPPQGAAGAAAAGVKRRWVDIDPRLDPRPRAAKALRVWLRRRDVIEAEERLAAVRREEAEASADLDRQLFKQNREAITVLNAAVATRGDDLGDAVALIELAQAAGGIKGLLAELQSRAGKR